MFYSRGTHCGAAGIVNRYSLFLEYFDILGWCCCVPDAIGLVDVHPNIQTEIAWSILISRGVMITRVVQMGRRRGTTHGVAIAVIPCPLEPTVLQNDIVYPGRDFREYLLHSLH